MAGCAGPLSTLEPAGPVARSVDVLWWAMLGGAALLFALVMVLFWMSFARPEPIRRIRPMAWIVGLGLAMPVAVLTILTTAALVQGERMLARAVEPAPMRIEVMAAMWFWEFSYPEIAGAAPTRDVLHMPAGQPVDLVLRSADVIHGFWIPRLGGKLDAIPGHVNVVRLEADEPGQYQGVCAEFCGVGHTDMRFAVEAHAGDDLLAALGVTGER